MQLVVLLLLLVVVLLLLLVLPLVLMPMPMPVLVLGLGLGLVCQKRTLMPVLALVVQQEFSLWTQRRTGVVRLMLRQIKTNWLPVIAAFFVLSMVHQKRTHLNPILVASFVLLASSWMKTGKLLLVLPVRVSFLFLVLVSQQGMPPLGLHQQHLV